MQAPLSASAVISADKASGPCSVGAALCHIHCADPVHFSPTECQDLPSSALNFGLSTVAVPLLDAQALESKQT